MANTLGPAAVNHVMNGSAKAWSRINQTSTQTVNDSFNISSITDDGTGRTEYSLSNSMNSANYCANGTSHSTNYWPSWVGSYGSHTMTSSIYAHQGWDYSENYRDLNNLTSAVHGDLA